MVRKAVVIGAGQTGRGYVCRFLFEKGYDITLIDKDKNLVDLLYEEMCIRDSSCSWYL